MEETKTVIAWNFPFVTLCKCLKVFEIWSILDLDVGIRDTPEVLPPTPASAVALFPACQCDYLTSICLFLFFLDNIYMSFIILS